MMKYEIAYKKADAWMGDLSDKLLQDLVKNLDEKDRGTVRDRIADALVIGSSYPIGTTAVSTERVSRSLTILKNVISLKTKTVGELP